MESIKRKTLLYKTGVEYGDYTINHIEGCSHGCKYPCYAFMLARRYGRVKTYGEWLRPKIVENAEELLLKELPKLKDKIKSVQLCFSTDPFMHGYKEVSDLSMKLISILNEAGICASVLTKNILPVELSESSRKNLYGISLVSLDRDFKEKYEPFSAPVQERITSLYNLHEKGMKTWVSVEPYPTPNIINQDIKELLDIVKFVDKIIFGKMNYNPLVSEYKGFRDFYKKLSNEIIEYGHKNNIEVYIKKGTL